jgi:hypothetical protein
MHQYRDIQYLHSQIWRLFKARGRLQTEVQYICSMDSEVVFQDKNALKNIHIRALLPCYQAVLL